MKTKIKGFKLDDISIFFKHKVSPVDPQKQTPKNNAFLNLKRSERHLQLRLRNLKSHSWCGFEMGVLETLIGGVPRSTPFTTQAVKLGSFGSLNFAGRNSGYVVPLVLSTRVDEYLLTLLRYSAPDEWLGYHLRYSRRPEEVDEKTWEFFKRKMASVHANFGHRHFARRKVNPNCDPVSFIKRFANVKGSELTLGFDTEWQDVVINGENVSFPLSYQFSTTLDGVEHDFVFYTGAVPIKTNAVNKLKLASMLYYIVTRELEGYGFIIFEERKPHHKTKYYESCTINLVAHFGGVDYFSCRDYEELYAYTNLTSKEQQKVNRLRNDIATIEKRNPTLTAAEVDKIEKIKEEIQQLEKNARHKHNLIHTDKHCLMTVSPRVYNFWVQPRRLRCEFKLNLRDTMKLSAPKTKLADLGAALGIEKMDTEALDVQDGHRKGYYKSHMYELRKKHPVFFSEYAIRDARISYEWYMKMLSILKKDGVTISSIAADIIMDACNQIAVENQVPGTNITNMFSYDRDVRGFGYDENGNPDYGKYHDSRRVFGDLPDKAYYGGRNEAFTHGLHPEKSYDYDLRSAYPFAMQQIPANDFNEDPLVFEAGRTLTTDDWEHIAQAGFGHVRWKFPKSVQFPSIPAKSKKQNLKGTPVFLREGEGLVSAPDVYAALVLGATVTVTRLKFRLFRVKRDRHNQIEIHMLGQAIRELVERRESMAQRYGPKSPEALLMKIINNSIYGKTGQGIHGNTARNILTDDMEDIPFSKITDGVFASTVTSVVRQTLALIMNFIQREGYIVYSVTTDGFISNYPPHKTHRIDAYLNDISSVYQEVLQSCWDGKYASVLEVKHVNENGFFNVKTRGNIAFNAEGVFASAGYSGDETYRAMDDMAQREHLLRAVLQREGRIEDSKTSMMSFREVKNGHIKSIQKFYRRPEDGRKRLSMDFDRKRRLIRREHSCSTFEINGVKFKSDYGYFTTEPFDTMAQYEHSADVLDSFLDMNYNIKTDEDLEAFQVGLKRGFPNFRLEDVSKLNSVEKPEFIKKLHRYKIRHFLILLLLEDQYLTNYTFEAARFQPKDYIKLLAREFKVPEKEIKYLWKNVFRLRRSEKNYTFDLKMARHVYSELARIHVLMYPQVV